MAPARPPASGVHLFEAKGFGMVVENMTIVGDRRFIPDRRSTNKPSIYNRRVRPDRRLNSIIVDWVPNNEVLLQPSLFKAYMKAKTRK